MLEEARARTEPHVRTPAFAFPRVSLPLPYVLFPMSIACPSYVTVIRYIPDRHMLFILPSCLCRCHLLPSRRVGGTDIATRVGWSGKYHDVSGRHMAVEHDVEQGRRTRVDVTRFQWRTRGGAGVPGGAAMVREIPRRQPGAHRRARRRDHLSVDLWPSSSSLGRLASSLTRMELD